MTGRITSRPSAPAEDAVITYRQLLEAKVESLERLNHALRRAVHRFVQLEQLRAERRPGTLRRVENLRALALEDARRALS